LAQVSAGSSPVPGTNGIIKIHVIIFFVYIIQNSSLS